MTITARQLVRTLATGRPCAPCSHTPGGSSRHTCAASHASSRYHSTVQERWSIMLDSIPIRRAQETGPSGTGAMAHEQRRQGEPSPERPAFHELLLCYRTAANESLQEFADALRVSPKAVQTYERPPQHPSARTPPTEVFRRLCAHLQDKGVLQGGEYAAFVAAWTARRRYRRVVKASPG
jgi:hypothetical protein